MAYGDWPPYVSVAQEKATAQRALKKLRKEGVDICPIDIAGIKIARTFWGEAWCKHLERFSDFANRLPRGKRYVRNGSVCHLEIGKGVIHALVNGSQLYDIEVVIKPMGKKRWETIQKNCMGQIGTVLELLQGKLSDSVMEVVTHPKDGLFPHPQDIQLNCNCPDWARLCKHLAAVLYAVGAMLDKQPELLFKLRGVDHETLISADIALPTGSSKRRRLDSNIGDVFGIELDTGLSKGAEKKRATKSEPAKTKKAKKRQPAGNKSGSKSKAKSRTKSKSKTKAKTQANQPKRN